LVAFALGLTVTAGVVVYFVRYSGRGADYDTALQAIGRRDFRAAGESLDRCLASRPNDTEVRLLAARTARRRGALEEFQKHIAIYKEQKGQDRSWALEYKLNKIQRGDLSEGELHLRSVSAAPAELESSLTLEAVIEGSLFALQSRSGQASRIPAGAVDRFVILGRSAVDLWLKSHPDAPDQVQGLIWRGRIRAAAGEFDSAVSDFREAIKLNPGSFDARFQLAITIGSFNHVEAAALLERLREAEPENKDVLAALATAYRLLGRPQDARDLYRGLVDRGNDDPRLLNELGLTELDAGRPAEAERVLRQVLEKHPDDLVANLAMTRCMMLAGKHDEAGRFRERYEAARAKTHSPSGVSIKP